VSLAIFKTKIFFMAAFFQGWVFSIETSFFLIRKKTQNQVQKFRLFKRLFRMCEGRVRPCPFPEWGASKVENEIGKTKSSFLEESYHRNCNRGTLTTKWQPKPAWPLSR
jgi:hypothetical protein